MYFAGAKSRIRKALKFKTNEEMNKLFYFVQVTTGWGELVLPWPNNTLKIISYIRFREDVIDLLIERIRPILSGGFFDTNKYYVFTGPAGLSKSFYIEEDEDRDGIEEQFEDKYITSHLNHTFVEVKRDTNFPHWKTVY